MNNIFVTDLFAGWIPKRSEGYELPNKILRKLRLPVSLLPPVHTGTMTSVEQRINMYHLVSSVLFYEVPGDLVELGCNTGQSAAVFQKVIESYDPTRTLHVYDSFEGLPELAAQDGATPFRAGHMSNPEAEIRANFELVGLKPPTIHKGWFEDTLADGLPEHIAFAHLDGDLYDSIKVSLEHVYPKLSKGAVCLIDDYCDREAFDAVEQAPGVKKACDEFFADKPENVSLLYGGYDTTNGYGSHGYFRKL